MSAYWRRMNREDLQWFIARVQHTVIVAWWYGPATAGLPINNFAGCTVFINVHLNLNLCRATWSLLDALQRELAQQAVVFCHGALALIP